MSNKIEITKKVARAIVALGTGRITYAIIRNNVAEDSDHDKKIDAITVPAASFIVGGMAAEAAGNHTDKFIDDVVDLWNTLNNKTNN